MPLLLGILALGLAGTLSFVGILSLSLAPPEGHAQTWSSLKRFGIAALPLAFGTVAFVVGLASAPLWPDQDETPERRAAQLAAQAFADRAFAVSTTLSTGSGLLITLSLIKTRRRAS